MVPILSLLLPIFVSAVFVFIVSSIVHMALGYHANDHLKLPDETAAADALRKLNIPDGDYALPKPSGMKEMNSAEFQEKVKKGPNAIITIWGGETPSMGKQLALWFLYSVVISIFAAYVAGRALGVGADYLSVFRFAGVTAFACYGVGDWGRSIWWRQKWSVTAKNTFDAFLYACVTAGAFGWLWPR